MATVLVSIAGWVLVTTGNFNVDEASGNHHGLVVVGREVVVVDVSATQELVVLEDVVVVDGVPVVQDGGVSVEDDAIVDVVASGVHQGLVVVGRDVVVDEDSATHQVEGNAVVDGDSGTHQGLVVVELSGTHQGLVVLEGEAVVDEISGTHQGLVLVEGEDVDVVWGSRHGQLAVRDVITMSCTETGIMKRGYGQANMPPKLDGALGQQTPVS